MPRTNFFQDHNPQLSTNLPCHGLIVVPLHALGAEYRHMRLEDLTFDTGPNVLLQVAMRSDNLIVVSGQRFKVMKARYSNFPFLEEVLDLSDMEDFIEAMLGRWPEKEQEDA